MTVADDRNGWRVIVPLARGSNEPGGWRFGGLLVAVLRLFGVKVR